jgi:hypothetical protein
MEIREENSPITQLWEDEAIITQLIEEYAPVFLELAGEGGITTKFEKESIIP